MAFDISYTFEAIDAYSPVIRKIQQQTAAATRSIETMSVKMARAGKKMSEVGRNITFRMGLPLAVFGVTAVKVSTDFEKSMNMVGAVSDATAEQYKALREEAIKLGETTQYTARNAAEAEKFLALAGFGTVKILQALPAVLQLAASAQLDMGSAANITTNVMAAYNLNAKDMESVNNILVKAFTSAKINLSELGQAFKMAGGVLGAMKIPVNEAAAAFGVLGNSGVSATMAGRGLRRSIASMINPSSSALKIMHKYGLTFVDSEGKMKDFISIIDEMNKKNVSAADIMKMFGMVGGTVMLNLVQHNDKLKDLNKSLTNAGDISDKISAAQMKGLPGATKKLTSSYEHLSIMLSTQMKPALMRVYNLLTKTLRASADSGPVIRTLVGGFTMFGIVLGPVIMGLGHVLLLIALLQRTGAATVAINALSVSFKFLYRSMLGPVGLALTLMEVFRELYKTFASVRTTINSLAGVMAKLAFGMPTGMGKQLFGMVETKLSGASPTKVSPVASQNALTHKINSTVDINVKDKGGYISSVSGSTNSGIMNLFTGRNMAASGAY